MDDKNNNNQNYNDFFKEREDADSKSQEKTEYHYSYGPFKSSNRYIEVSPSEPNSSVYSEEPRKQMVYHAPKKKKSSFRSTFAAFLVGVIVMGSFMIASDKMDLFTSGDASVPESPLGSQIYSHMNTNEENTGDVSPAMAIVRPNTIADIVSNSSPAVVKIETVASQRSGGGSGNPFFNDDFFNEFFGQSPNEERRVAGVGSGFIFDQGGYILTNQHVLQGAEEIYVTVQGYTEPFKAKLLGSDFDLDLAVVKIEGDKSFPTLKMGNSSQLRVGDWVTAIGNPMGFDHTVSVGVISANEREINIQDRQGARRYKNLLQTDASINPGNSGGPLLNLNGEVIGINTAVSAQGQGIGFAIPTSTIIEVLDNLKNNEEIPKPFIGVYLSDIDDTWQENLQLQSTEGALITQLESGSPAGRAGLRPGDVIVKMNDRAIDNTDTLVSAIREKAIGEKLELVIIREGRELEAAVIVGDRNQQ